jgi:quinoprotein glucose dehydrogenase
MKKTTAFLLSVATLFYACKPEKKFNTWTQYKGSDENIHYSSLTQIDTNNVNTLQVAWEYHTVMRILPMLHKFSVML